MIPNPIFGLGSLIGYLVDKIMKRDEKQSIMKDKFISSLNEKQKIEYYKLNLR